MIRRFLLTGAAIASGLLCALPVHAGEFIRILNATQAPEHICFCVRAYGVGGAKDGRYACTSQYGQTAESALPAGTIKKFKITAFNTNTCAARAYGANGNHLVSRIVTSPGSVGYMAQVQKKADGKYEIQLTGY